MHSLGGVEDSLKAQLVADYKTADISDQDKQILDYAEKITKNPAAISKEDILALQNNGFSNEAIHDIAQVTSYFNYVNRMADALGIELESE